MDQPIIFIVDDDVQVLRAITRDLKNKFRQDYRVLSTSSAKEILRQALEGESDPCVAECIRASLTAFANKRRPYYVSDDVRTKWYSSFLCNGE